MKLTLDNINEVAKDIILSSADNKVIAVTGEMGAGKTTLIQALCKVLGVSGRMSSPTFPIINEYFTTDGKVIFHIDAYRLTSISEAVNAGVEESIYSGEYCFIEWPQNVEALLPENLPEVFLEKISETSREISIKFAKDHIRLKS